MTNELEPCPFRKEGDTHELTIIDELGEAWVRCSCGVAGPMFSGPNRKEQAAEHWNTRYKRTCEWNIKHSGTLYDVYQCSACGYEYAESRTDHGIKVELCDAKFCPNCGAEVLDGD